MATQFDLSGTTKLDNTSKILYNYYNTTISSGDVKVENSGNLNYYKINVSYPVNTPNALYPDSLGTFIANKIYLSGVLHEIIQIPNTNTVGELIIEHTPLTGTGKLFVCILLNYSSNIVSDKNSVDDLIDIASSDDKRKQIALNSSILTQPNAIVYKENVDTIIVFVSPIYISSASKNKITSLAKLSLFTNYSSTYKILPQNSISMVDKDEIYIDCSPTGASAEEIATYNVPINSEYTQDAGKLDFMKTTIQLCLVFLLIVITYYSVPFFYKTIVVDNIKKLIHTDIDKKNRNLAIDIILVLLSVVFLIQITYNGVLKNDFDSVLNGVYFFVIFGLSVAIIGYNRETNYFEDAYRNATLPDSSTSAKIMTIFLEIAMFIKDCFMFTFVGPRTGKTTINGMNILSISVLYGITAVSLFLLSYMQVIEKNVFYSWLKTMAYLIVFGVSIVALINKTHEQSKNDAIAPLA
jgi:hypothetical protein